jgi:hypothetical protein
MRNKRKNRRLALRKTELGLPDLDHAKAGVLASLSSLESQRSYGYTHRISTSYVSAIWSQSCSSRTAASAVKRRGGLCRYPIFRPGRGRGAVAL